MGYADGYLCETGTTIVGRKGAINSLLINYEKARRVGPGNNQKALNKEHVCALRFPFASYEEQHIIVEAIESRLSVCDSI